MNYDGYTKYDSKVARSYDQDRRGEAHWRAEYDWLAAYAARERLGRVLDIPVGTGRLLPALASADAIVGVDVSEDMLEVARGAVAQAGLVQVELREGDALHLQDADRAFDTVSCFRLAHLLPPEMITPLMLELSRVCAGRIVMQVYVAPDRITRWPPLAWLIRQVRRLRSRQQLPWSHIQSYPHTWRLFERAFKQAGLKVLTRHPLDRYGGSTVEVVELSR
jgi:ubiquinone/menaquinone biosynthesis C-methylase UbiE